MKQTGCGRGTQTKVRNFSFPSEIIGTNLNRRLLQADFFSSRSEEFR